MGLFKGKTEDQQVVSKGYRGRLNQEVEDHQDDCYCNRDKLARDVMATGVG